MDRLDLQNLLEDVASGRTQPEEAARAIQAQTVTDLGFARIDDQRGIRTGASEVIYGEGKSADQIAQIVAAMLGKGAERILITRLDADKASAVQDLISDGLSFEGSDDTPDFPLFTYYDLPRVATIGTPPEPDGRGAIVVATGGTSDIYAAEEAALTAEMLGNKVTRLYDVGVAGLHRLLDHGDDIASASVIVAVAGMEGALASVIAGLASCPVVAVPTSVGYGASFGGVSALLSMVNSCAAGVSVVNIDNGFGAGFQASLINHVK